MAASFPTSVVTDATLGLTANGAATTLNGALNNSATTVTVADTSSFAASGYFTIDSEICTYTSKNSTQFLGVTRGVDSSAAASHLTLAAVNGYIISAHIRNMQLEIEAIEQNISTRFGLGSTDVLVGAGNLNVNSSASPNLYVSSTSGGGVQLRLLASSTSAGYIQTNTNHPLIFTTNNGSNAIQIDTSQRVIIGTGNSRTVNGVDGIFQVEGTSAAARPSFIINLNTAAGSLLQLGKSRGGSNGSVTIVQNNDFTGGIYMMAANGVDMSAATAYILSSVMGTPSATSMPGRLDLATTAVGSIGPAVAMSIAADQTIYLGNGSTGNSTTITTLKFVTDSGAVRYAGISGFRRSDAANIDLRFYTMAGDGGGILERMRIMNSGFVAIGAADALSQLSVYGTNTKTHFNLTLTISNNSVADLTSYLVAGSINTVTVMCQSETKWSLIAQFRMGGTPSIIKIGGGANADVSTTLLAGTTGVNGNITLSSQATAAQLENRSGGSAQFYLTIMSGG